MKRLAYCLLPCLFITLITIHSNSAMAFTMEGSLSECAVDTNCVLVEREVNDLKQSYENLLGVASQLPRTKVLEQTNNYWHAVVRSLVFRFPDDLEILQIPSQKVIQVRSASRIGVSDLGVNKQRVDSLFSSLTKD
ncbi:hypothetical protein PMIT1313_00291 [Prochlorococcus marinus str. MIT 1313]|uniref:DUF1499 domain-containing protein n=1 Tax=Prochlorococcus TaxID=1218 RepID=UPI0007C12FFB|nr:DUF1499 domain-containing protein [Prochlorococcus marinus]KZR70637.1 hypothetical protein PMIT1313_00291 [Prochlorococcus marinus str. MIT 1313]